MQKLSFPKVALASLPTPVQELPRLSEHLQGPPIYIKRDDQTGLALGGNKTRKLEYLLGDALAQGCDTVLTAGAVQSNHCRQTAAACAVLGLDCHLILGGEPPAQTQGNLLLDQLLGATMHFTGRQDRIARMNEVHTQLAASGKLPYSVPYGGSNALGALAYVDALFELQRQSAIEFSHILFASSSGGTQAGLAVGKRWLGLSTHILGVDIDKRAAGEAPFADEILQIARDATELLNGSADNPGLEQLEASDIELNANYLGGGYAVVGDAEVEAISLLARLEGVLLDPVYTGRAMAGLIDMVRRREIDDEQPILFWHTGGAPALFAWNEMLSAQK